MDSFSSFNPNSIGRGQDRPCLSKSSISQKQCTLIYSIYYFSIISRGVHEENCVGISGIEFKVQTHTDILEEDILRRLGFKNVLS